MRMRSFASLILGAWISASLFMILVATQNFRTVDRLLDHPAPEAAESIQALEQTAPGSARSFLRYMASEQNRWFFETWEQAQLALGAGFLATIVLGMRRSRAAVVMSAILLAIVIIQHWALTPEIVRLGRLIDFTARSAASPERDRFWNLHHLYSGLEVFKLGMTVPLAGLLLVRGRRRSGSAVEVDAVDEPNYRHINR